MQHAATILEDVARHGDSTSDCIDVLRGACRAINELRQHNADLVVTNANLRANYKRDEAAHIARRHRLVELEKQNERLQSTITGLHTTLRVEQKQRSTYPARIRELEDQINELRREPTAACAAMKAAQMDRNAAESKVRGLEKALADTQRERGEALGKVTGLEAALKCLRMALKETDEDRDEARKEAAALRSSLDAAIGERGTQGLELWSVRDKLDAANLKATGLEKELEVAGQTIAELRKEVKQLLDERNTAFGSASRAHNGLDEAKVQLDEKEKALQSTQRACRNWQEESVRLDGVAEKYRIELNRANETLAELTEKLRRGGRADDPSWDGTEAAHPAWWRGRDSGIHNVLKRVLTLCDGTSKETGYDGELGEVARKILELRSMNQSHSNTVEIVHKQNETIEHLNSNVAYMEKAISNYFSIVHEKNRKIEELRSELGKANGELRKIDNRLLRRNNWLRADDRRQYVRTISSVALHDPKTKTEVRCSFGGYTDHDLHSALEHCLDAMAVAGAK
jgi:chromosome segregation ATPase